MARALQIFALLSAFFVVAVRCLSAFPVASAAAGEGFSGKGAALARPSSDDTQDRESLTVADTEDDTDDAADALIASTDVRVVPFVAADSAGVGCGVTASQRALPSHAQCLDRPPRA